MLQYEYPIFDFSAPIEFATRAEEAKSKNPHIAQILCVTAIA